MSPFRAYWLLLKAQLTYVPYIHVEPWLKTKHEEQIQLFESKSKKERLAKVWWKGDGKGKLCWEENSVTSGYRRWTSREFCICRILIRRVWVFPPSVCPTNEHDRLHWVVQGPHPLSSPFAWPVWLLPLSFPHTTVSPISRGLDFITASLLPPAAFCHIPDNKPETGSAIWHTGSREETTAHTDKGF